MFHPGVNVMPKASHGAQLTKWLSDIGNPISQLNWKFRQINCMRVSSFINLSEVEIAIALTPNSRPGVNLTSRHAKNPTRDLRQNSRQATLRGEFLSLIIQKPCYTRNTA
jgi:hypothetical protein